MQNIHKILNFVENHDATYFLENRESKLWGCCVFWGGSYWSALPISFRVISLACGTTSAPLKQSCIIWLNKSHDTMTVNKALMLIIFKGYTNIPHILHNANFPALLQNTSGFCHDEFLYATWKTEIWFSLPITQNDNNYKATFINLIYIWQQTKTYHGIVTSNIQPWKHTSNEVHYLEIAWGCTSYITWWCHQMETFSVLLALCEGNPPVTSGFPSQRQLNTALMFSLICAWTNSWANNRDTGNLRHNCTHYEVAVMRMTEYWQFGAQKYIKWNNLARISFAECIGMQRRCGSGYGYVCGFIT